ncbi:cryptochrome/photolyase family protein [Exilibacterium tricleocarpae]|uniref:Cryptochrome/photolyase family protein n=1 Tax=Exilibacterium tricleocarpae TaxID=2591008 RepID=A0A545SQN7_9GAMM|nr:cryptochrome/photolyase family protein [Exilibacterium tricleocarpae]TQV67278.1 cryptochrome/photolyase family protein [Exilibacterium tricleocarpae]
MGALRLILGDQLSHTISCLSDCDKQADTILICEVWEEATYVKHHKKKIAFIFSTMRHFAQELTEAGYQVDYIKLDDPGNTGSFTGEVERAIHRHRPEQVVATFPGEYRVLEGMHSWPELFQIDLVIREDERFLCSREDFESWAAGRKQPRMEYFYREMRKRYSILMDGDSPAGDRWNFDAENRLSPSRKLAVPTPYHCEPDAVTREVMALVEDRFADHFGDLSPFGFAVTRTQAFESFALFVKERLPFFGDYQDAMLQAEPWMYHAHCSFYLNCGLLDPLECVRIVEQAYRDGQASLNAAEGFIRQIIGWREYVRGIYWLKMPDYAEENFFETRRSLPAFFWDGDTSMNCMRQCIEETKHNAYAHHIQRLMVIGNFSLLCGLDPDAVNEWYLIVYADAYEWVELPNVSGMILYADGGYLASKPYAASGAYINKMSNYCQSCHYNVKEKTGPQACPFNYLYWDFLHRNREKLHRNPRLAMIYKTLDRMQEQKVKTLQRDADVFLRSLG